VLEAGRVTLRDVVRWVLVTLFVIELAVALGLALT
jgi:hypothetical protein